MNMVEGYLKLLELKKEGYKYSSKNRYFPEKFFEWDLYSPCKDCMAIFLDPSKKDCYNWFILIHQEKHVRIGGVCSMKNSFKKELEDE